MTDPPAQPVDDVEIPDGMVLRGPSSSQYHTTACNRIRDNARPMRREIAESWDTLSECRICQLTLAELSPAGNSSLCDNCGKTGARLTPFASEMRLCEYCRPGGDGYE